MTGRLEFTGLRDDADYEAFLDIACRSFGKTGDLEELRKRFDRVDRDIMRLGRLDGRPVSTLLFASMGQFFGGRSVPIDGVALVGVDPAARGGGVARRTMLESFRDSRERGRALSVLYAASHALYRSVGYERAGNCFDATVRLAELGAIPRQPELEVRALEGHEEERAAELWRTWAREVPGQLDRGPYMQARARRPQGREPQAYILGPQSDPEGYVRWVQTAASDGAYDVEVVDAAALTKRAGLGILGLLRGAGSVARRARWPSAPNDPLLQLLPERPARLELWEQWFVRVVDAKGALEARGYPAGLEAELELFVEDEDIAENHGALRLAVTGGRARVTAGGSGALRVSVRGLASLYTGFASPAELVRLGLAEGDSATLAVAEAIFAGPAPWMFDRF